MISTIFHGELGNNLFQLAHILAMSHKMGIDYELINKRDSWVSSFRPLEIKDLFETSFNFVERYTQDYTLHNHSDLHPNTTNYAFNYRDVIICDNTITRGYFQSEKYFLNIKDHIVYNLFKPRQDTVDYILQKYGSKLFNSVAIHLRAGGDRPFCYNSFPLLTFDYYKKALDIIESKTRIDNFLVFSDKMDIAKQTFPSEYTFIENESNIVDLTFMSMCSHNIIGNSTFSWWSAYLNKNSDKVVVAPTTNWFGGSLASYDRSDLFPESWIVL